VPNTDAAEQKIQQIESVGFFQMSFAALSG
jgi:hypothetical protein